MNELARERIEKGIALLDEKAPGWRDKINVEKLCLDLPSRCIIGQLYGGTTGDYIIGCRRLFGASWRHGDVAAYGFEEDNKVSYTALTEGWKDELAARP